MNLGIWTVTTQCPPAAVVDGKVFGFCSILLHTLALCIGEENLVNKLIGPLLLLLWEAIYSEKWGW